MDGFSRTPSAPAPRFDVFLSYNSRDQAVVEQIGQRLKAAGLEPWLDRWSLTPGGEWQRELGDGLDAAAACAVFVGPHDLGAWELQELALALDRAARERSFRLFPVLLPGVEEPFEPNRLPHFLRARTWVDFRRGLDDARALQDLVNAVNGVAFGPPANVSGAHIDGVVPYRGLRVFGEEDARFFFGRDGEVQRLFEKLKSSRFVAVLGPSGSGKSSLVRAGLVPRLRAGALTDGDEWRVRMLRPGAAPLTALAAQLSTLQSGQAMQATVDLVAQDPRSLHLSVELALADRPAGERVVVIVDQLEEIFTLCRDESQRRQLFANLLYASSTPGGRTVVIVTLRADFYARCAAYPEFAQLLAERQMLVGSMDADGLCQAIHEPAHRVGLELEDGLADTILTDVAAEPGALPLLAHALLELWKRRDGRTLTLRGYRQAGGVHGALAQRAEEIYGELTTEQRQIARSTLLRLTQPGEGTEDTRRRAPRSELAPTGASSGFDEVLARLVDARLLTTGRDETGVEIVDVSHEALVRGWPRLRAWIDADRQDLVVHRRLTDATTEWTRLGRDDSALYRGARLGEAQALRERDPDALNDAELSFLEASVAREEAARRKELDDARELAAAQRRAKRGYALVALILLGGVIIASVLTVIAFDARTDAQHQRNAEQRQAAEATSLALTSSASRLLNSRPDLSLLLAFEAYHISPRPEARSSVLSALTAARDPGLFAILRGHNGAVGSVAFTTDGRTLVSTSDDRTVRLWDVRTHESLSIPLKGYTDSVVSEAFSPDGRTLASAGFYEPIRLWDLRTGKQRGMPLKGHRDPVLSIAFSPDKRTLASAGLDLTIRLWDLRTQKQLGEPLKGHTSFVTSVAFSPDGRTLATTSGDRTVRLWDPRTHKQLGTPLTRHTGRVGNPQFSPGGHAKIVGSVAFSPDGRTLASTSGKAIRLWDVRTHKPLRALLTGHAKIVGSVAFSPDGRTLASTSGKAIRLWDLRIDKPLGTALTRHNRAVGSVAFSPDGRTLASTSGETIRLWDLRIDKPLGALLLTGHAKIVGSVRFSPDGRTLASTSGKAIRLWDARTHKPLGGPFKGHIGFVGNLAFSPDGRTLAVADPRGTIELWDLRTHKRFGRLLKRHSGSVSGLPPLISSVAFSPDGRTVASVSSDKTIGLWDVRTHKPLGAPLKGHTSFVTSVAFSPDGRTLASTSIDETIRLWDLRTHKPLGEPLNGRAVSVVFSPDGRTLASTSREAIRLWDVRTHKPLGTPLKGHTALVESMVFSPDGRTLLSASADNTVRLWDGLLWRNLAELRTEVCKLVGSGLTNREWAQNVPGISYRNSCP